MSCSAAVRRSAGAGNGLSAGVSALAANPVCYYRRPCHIHVPPTWPASPIVTTSCTLLHFPATTQAASALGDTAKSWKMSCLLDAIVHQLL